MKRILEPEVMDASFDGVLSNSLIHHLPDPLPSLPTAL